MERDFGKRSKAMLIVILWILLGIITICNCMINAQAEEEWFNFSGTWMTSVTDDKGKLIWLLEVGDINENGSAYASLTMMEWNTKGKMTVANVLEGYYCLVKDGGIIVLYDDDVNVGAIKLTTKRDAIGYFKFNVFFTKEDELSFKYIPTLEEDFANALLNY